MSKLLIYLFLIFPFSLFAQNDILQAVTSESKGYSSEKLAVLKAHLEASGSSSMLILVDGEVIFEWGDTQRKHLIHSIRKPILNSLIGIAVAKGQIDTNMTLAELGIEDIEPILSEEEKEARVIDLLKSRSGVYHASAAETASMRARKPERGSYKAGEHYYYNNWDFNVLGAILEQQTGKKIYDLFNEQIASPLRMQFKGKYVSLETDEMDRIPEVDGFYKYERELSNFPAYHFRLSARDLALYGQLYLNFGAWRGNQIIPKDWIAASTLPYSVYDEKYGNAYGMLWKVRVPNENTKRNSFFHTGVGIHMLGIYPDSKLVLVHRVDTEKDFDYQERDLYKMIGLVAASKITD